MSIKKMIHLLLLCLLGGTANTYAQPGAPYSGSITATVAGRGWTGTVQTAIYKNREDYLFIAFEDDTSRLEVTFKTLKSEISRYIPYKDEVQGDYKFGVDPNLVFFSRYFPNKKKTDYSKAFTMLDAAFFVDALDLTAGTIKIAFEERMGKATRRFDPLHPNEDYLEKIEIKGAESGVLRFISF